MGVRAILLCVLVREIATVIISAITTQHTVSVHNFLAPTASRRAGDQRATSGPSQARKHSSGMTKFVPTMAIAGAFACGRLRISLRQWDARTFTFTVTPLIFHTL